jgi:hypothetical protein
MTLRGTYLAFLWALLLLPGAALTSQDDIRRLPPSTFPHLPGRVRSDLERRGCTVPQVWYDTVPRNVVRGHFQRSGQLDWAVLCSVAGVSTILVYWDGQPDSLAALASGADAAYRQDVGGGRIGFSRAVGVVDARYIRQHFKWYGGTEPPPLDHEGISDAFVEKASVVWCWYQGRWLQLTGAD